MDALPYEPRLESLINDFLKKGYAISNELFSLDDISLWRQSAILEKENDRFRLAGIGDRYNFQKETTIRSDKNLWLNRQEANTAEKNFFDFIDRFSHYLNISCYAGIKRSEFHYAIYEAGSFYHRHLDQFQGDDSRRFSIVLYLTEKWTEGDGGELAIYKKNSEQGMEKRTLIQPLPGRLIFFDSSLEHEVLLSKSLRISLTGWMRGS